MTNLIARIEAAQPSEAWIVFGEAFRSAFPETDGFICGRKWADLYAGFVIYMNAEAYLDAAAMFVPEGWSYVLRPGYAQMLHAMQPQKTRRRAREQPTSPSSQQP